MVYDSKISAINSVSTLDGRIYAFAELNNPFGRDPRYEHTILKWNGYETEGVLYSDNYQAPVF
jgi:hypothetical protein